MQTIILSAGKSRRFTEDGFPLQKCLLPMPDGRKLLEWQLERLPRENVLYISRKEYRKQEEAIIKKVRLTLPNFTSVWLNVLTKGALDGIWAARNYIERGGELLIQYNDEIVDPGVLGEMITKARRYNYSAALVCFLSQNPRYTPVPDTKLFAGCTYYFRDGKDFLNKVKMCEKGEQNGVPDAVYSFRRWLAYQVPEDHIIELGTAPEYKFWAAQHGMTKETMGF